MAALFNKPLTINQGATFIDALTWSAGEPAVPVDLTGCTGRMQIRLTQASPNIIAELTTENGGIVLGGVAGTIALKIPAVQTERFAWTTAVYDLELVFLDETVVRIVEGVVSVSAGVTR